MYTAAGAYLGRLQRLGYVEYRGWLEGYTLATLGRHALAAYAKKAERPLNLAFVDEIIGLLRLVPKAVEGDKR